jgi:UDP-N-acetylmuramoyl-tripeptide--D-alanyl-D-alanine ligase
MEVRRSRGATLLLDYYNANPDSAKAALAALATWPAARRRIAVLGDMLELGEAAASLHEQVGRAVAQAELWVVGAHAGDYERGARANGIEVRSFADKTEAARALHDALVPGTVVLLKASRGAKLEEVVRDLAWEA